ncbi:nuclear transport factor 2 family protein [Membranihabitans marinus]|uniref:nuclear transport factor 2 family protein n=1 Tax=Membranihabitans marinus TaxID=1227546 RepID=UPI001F169306|nr:nuclear transport factor 2 family protein [Membranihabitans marinus]
MELKENKALVAEFIKAMSTSNVDQLKTMITDDFTWWIIGKPEYLATAGEHDAEYFLGFFESSDFFPEGTDFKPTSIIAEGNKVAAEAEIKAKTAVGTQYENYYHFLFTIENGKINRMKEYMDTHHAKVIFGL